MQKIIFIIFKENFLKYLKAKLILIFVRKFNIKNKKNKFFNC